MGARYDWQIIRSEYEAGMTQNGISLKYGVSRAALSQRVRREGWKRNESGSDPGEEGGADKHPPAPAGQCGVELPAKSRSESNGKNAVIRRHREEWNRVRILIDDAVTEQDAEAAKLAKLTAETLKIRQEGERKAWGITDRAETEISGGVTLTWQK